MSALACEKLNSYLSHLNSLRQYAQTDGEGDFSEGEQDRIRGTILSFLTAYDSGIAYKDGLKYTAWLIVKFNLTFETLTLSRIKNEKTPEIRIISWLASQNLQKSVLPLTVEDILFCDSRPFWNSIFIEGLKRWPGTDSVPDEAMFRFSPRAEDYQSHIIIARACRERGGATRSSEILRRGLSMADRKTVLRYEAIRELRDQGLIDEAVLLIKEALLIGPELQDIEEFTGICAIARAHGLYDEAFRATLRFPGEGNESASEQQRFYLDTILLEEHLKQGPQGFFAGLGLYRKHRQEYLRKTDIPGFFPGLAVAAHKMGDTDVIGDIAAHCKDRDLPETPEWWRLRAEVLEFSRAWDEAYSYWEKLHGQEPKNTEVLCRLIENRLICHDENNADRFVGKMADINDPRLRIPALSYQVLANTLSPTLVIEITRKNKDILDRTNPLFERVLLAYSEALCAQYEWRELEKVNDLDGTRGFVWTEFFAYLARIMNFSHAVEAQRQPDMNAAEALSLSRKLISSRISPDQILILLNVNLIDRIKKALIKSDRKLAPLTEELAEEMELRVALEAEALIMKLEARNRDTQDYRNRLRKMTLGLGSRQLLEDLEREYRSTGVGVQAW